MYKEKDLVRIAKRENNNARNYLVVNRLQAKHIPAVPSEAIGMFDSLAEMIKGRFDAEKTLLIGFAETATAIGSHLAVRLGSAYMQTTREDIEGAEYLYFTESHSHAVEQRLVKNQLSLIAEHINDIVFVEDELTTGNTILKAVGAIKAAYPDRSLHFSAASILNGMDKNALEVFEKENVDVYYLVKTDHSVYPDIAQGYCCDGIYNEVLSSKGVTAGIHTVKGAPDPRVMTDGKTLCSACSELAERICSRMDKRAGENILVIGTEECMYPAIFTGTELEKRGYRVRTHSTTRSPIAVSGDPDYPLHRRYKLKSLYDSERTTFIYDVDKYDRVLVITDAGAESSEGTDSLVAAIGNAGNDRIDIVRWEK